MKVDLFDFDLPDHAIALRPVNPRDSARMLVVDPISAGQELTDRQVHDLADLVEPGDALVFNDTRVIPAQLEGIRLRDGAGIQKVSVTLHMRLAANQWAAFAKPAKRIKPGDRLVFSSADGSQHLKAEVSEKRDEGEIILTFDATGPDLDSALADVGHIPLPPYISAKRPEDSQDRQDYQTIYAREQGAVAAPTAGLHFTPDLFAKLDASGIERHFVTLHVGAGTFLPVKADDTADHKMHLETGTVTVATAEALNAVKARGGKVIAVGTTSLRLLESATDGQGVLQGWSGSTGIFITPGYRFKFVDRLMTNFHLPRSTLFMLVSAFSGLDIMHKAYRHAIETGYRFYSYGDSSLLTRKDP